MFSVLKISLRIMGQAALTAATAAAALLVSGLAFAVMSIVVDPIRKLQQP
jgi:hypothetical protein